MRVRWSLTAAADLEGISDWLQERSPLVAHRTVQEIYTAIGRLSRFPELGRLGVVHGTRELMVPHVARAVYKIRVGQVHILRVIHGRQDQ